MVIDLGFVSFEVGEATIDFPIFRDSGKLGEISLLVWSFYLITHHQLGLTLFSGDILLISINYLRVGVTKRKRMNRLGSPHLIMMCQSFFDITYCIDIHIFDWYPIINSFPCTFD